MAKTTSLSKAAQTPASRADLDALIRGGGEEPSKRINVHVPAELHRAFKVKAAQQGTTMKDLLQQWIEEYVSK